MKKSQQLLFGATGRTMERTEVSVRESEREEEGQESEERVGSGIQPRVESNET